MNVIPERIIFVSRGITVLYMHTRANFVLAIYVISVEHFLLILQSPNN